MTNSLSILPKAIDGAELSAEQVQYLQGFLSGMSARGISFADVEAMPQAVIAPTNEEVTAEERIKRELHPLDAYPVLLENAVTNKAPEKEDAFRFKWSGLFHLGPTKDAYMARLRIPGGILKTFQLRELAQIARELTTGYVQVTTRSNFQIRLIEPRNAPEVLRRIQAVGLHTRGAGGDNLRNFTMNPTAGFDPHELIDVTPFIHELAQLVISSREFYDLPRKFNVAIDGGGLIGAVEDTNDIGASAVEEDDAVWFRLKLGGATGHKAFAQDLGVRVKPEQLVRVIAAVIRVFIANGDRTNRKRARLKHLLESWSLEEYQEETEKMLGFSLERSTGVAREGNGRDLPHSHIGAYPQRQPGLNYLGVALPIGQITPKQMIRVAEIADLYGSGEIRLTVWQNLLIPNIPDAYLATVQKAVAKAGLGWKQSNVRSGIIACTGSRYCKYAAADTKGDAAQLAEYLEKRVELDQPINIHLTGCPHSCAQHYMGDIGLLGTKVKLAGESVEGYHVFVGGGFGSNQALGRQVFNGIPSGDLPTLVERMLRGYLRRRQEGETFQEFSKRHDVGDLQGIFSNDE